MKIIKVNASLCIGLVGCSRDDIVEIEVPNNYDITNDPDKLIQTEVQEWVFERLDWGWDIIV